MLQHVNRRKFMKILGSASAAINLGALTQSSAQSTAQSAGASTAPPGRNITPDATVNRKNVVATQVKAYAWQDEGIDNLLDNLQHKGNINTVYAFTFLAGSGRIEKGGPIILPDHGKYGEADEGGAYYDADPKYFQETTLRGGHSPDKFNVITEVAPKMKARGMDFIAWDYNNSSQFMSRLFPGFAEVCEVDVYGRRTFNACWNHPNYRAQLRNRIESYLLQYPDLVAGIMWGCERMGPLDNMIGGGWSSPEIGCFCDFCLTKGRARGISVDRARAGYIKLDALFQAAKKQKRPADGFFVSFWRILLEYPEILAWHTLWNDSYHEVRGEVYGTAKMIAPTKPFGFHMVQNITFSPFYSAVDDYAKIKHYTDFVKIASYSNAGGGRMAGFVDHLCSTIFADIPAQEFMPIVYRMMGYDEKPYAEVKKHGLSADYVARETKRAIADTAHQVQVYASVDVNTPTVPGADQSTPEAVKAEVNAALGAGADGVVFTREYTEAFLTNLQAGGDATRAFFARG
jgi:hypothetical protein